MLSLLRCTLDVNTPIDILYLNEKGGIRILILSFWLRKVTSGPTGTFNLWSLLETIDKTERDLFVGRVIGFPGSKISRKLLSSIMNTHTEWNKQ